MISNGGFCIINMETHSVTGVKLDKINKDGILDENHTEEKLVSVGSLLIEIVRIADKSFSGLIMNTYFT